ncbi:hypothetical protein [Paenibacillus alginolyticus]|nr:hypothetical protein [Paenibacillus alginolyticus]MEC0144824.1 hypothetical protein [Paenibacillus alginolyticus]
MRIIIADDETWVRTTIKNMLLELDMQCISILLEKQAMAKN